MTLRIFKLSSFKECEQIENMLNNKDYNLSNMVEAIKNSGDENYEKHPRFCNIYADETMLDAKCILDLKKEEFINEYILPNVVFDNENLDNDKQVCSYIKITINNNILNINDYNKKDIEKEFQKHLNSEDIRSFNYQVFINRFNDYYNLEIDCIHRYSNFSLPNEVAKRHIVRDILKAIKVTDSEYDMIKDRKRI